MAIDFCQHNIDGFLPKGPYPPCLRMADRALLPGYPRICRLSMTGWMERTTNDRFLGKAVLLWMEIWYWMRKATLTLGTCQYIWFVQPNIRPTRRSSHTETHTSIPCLTHSVSVLLVTISCAMHYGIRELLIGTWKVLSNSLVIEFIRGDVHGRWIQ